MLENENVNPETAISTEEQSATADDNANNNAESNSTTQNETSETAISADDSHDDEGNAEPTFALDVQYNKESRTLNRDEAKDFAEQGLFYSNKIKPIYNKLDYIAALKGTTPAEYIDGLIKADEEQHRQTLIDKFGEDFEELEQFMEIYRNSQQEKYQNVVNDRNITAENEKQAKIESNNTRLANEFIELQKEFPELKNIEDVPESVIEKAVKENRDLTLCYLLHKRSEELSIIAANKAAEDAKKASTGSGASSEKQDDGAIAALMNGLWN